MTTCSPRKENLIKPGPAEHRPTTFGHKGQVYDGWETRRRRGVTGDTHDAAIVRLAGPAVVRGVVVDTAWFTGNYPPADLGRGCLRRGPSASGGAGG